MPCMQREATFVLTRQRAEWQVEASHYVIYVCGVYDMCIMPTELLDIAYVAGAATNSVRVPWLHLYFMCSSCYAKIYSKKR